MGELISSAETTRPEIRFLGERIAARKAQLRMQENDGYPVIYVSGGYSFEENPYRVHEDWEKDATDSVGEIVRFAVVDARARNITSYGGFLDELVQVRQRIEGAQHSGDTQ